MEIITNTDIQTLLKANFDKGRLICVLRYGPKVSLGGLKPEDYDYLILLDRPSDADYRKVLKIKKELIRHEIFIEYRDYIESKGFKNYQRGCHGSYFLKILAEAECIVGNNFYKDKIKFIEENKSIDELFFRIEEYFYRIQKEILKNGNQFDVQKIKKTLLRIITDQLILNGNLSFSDMQTVHHSDILNVSIDKNLLGEKAWFTKLKKIFEKTSIKIDELNSIMNKMKEINVKLYKDIKHETNTDKN